MSYFKTAVCAIGRLENKYAREFVDHYLKLGFMTVIIADNNHDGEEHFEDVLQDYIDNGSVKILDYRNMIGYQMQCYTELYKRFKDEYDAVLLVDFDEFLVLEHDKTISEYISRFPNDWQAILINWDCKVDSGLIHYDPRPLVERFTESLNPIDKCVQYSNIPENAHIKGLIKCGLDNVFWHSNPHVPNTNLVCYNASGIRCSNAPWQPIDYRMARLLHFTTKSCEEYCNKLLRGTPDRTYDVFLKTYVGRYWRYNERTEEKVRFFEEKGYSGV